MSDPNIHRPIRPRSSPTSQRARMPSASAYMAGAAAAAAALFFLLWWMLQGEENPWIPAGLAASVVMLVAASAWLAVVRRSRGRYVRDSGEWRGRPMQRSSGNAIHSTSRHSAALRALHKQSLAADAR